MIDILIFLMVLGTSHEILQLLRVSELFLTIITGTLVFAFSQVLQRFLLEPWQEQTKVEGKIIQQMIFYKPYFANWPYEGGDLNFLKEYKDEIRKLSCELAATSRTNHYLKLNKEDTQSVCTSLIRLSNCMYEKNHTTNNVEEANKVLKKFKSFVD